MAMLTHADFNIDALEYSREVRTNKNTGAKSVDVTTVKGSNDPAHKVRFQLGVYSDHMMRAVFGVSKPPPGQENSNRRDIDLSIESDEVLTFLRRLDERNLQAAVDNSMDWFKKSIDKAVLRDRFKPIVKDSAKPEYRPTAKTKLIFDAERNNTQIHLVTKEVPAQNGMPPRVEQYKPITMGEIPRGAKAVAIVEANGVWLGANQFGMSLVLRQLIVWPTQRTQGIEAFVGLGGTPMCAPADTGYLPPPPATYATVPPPGIYADTLDDDMADVQ